MNVLHYQASNEALIERIFSETGYKKQSTFFGDLSVAEWFGIKGIEDTYKDICEHWFNDVQMFTEFVMCLNHKCHQHYAYHKAIERGRQLQCAPQGMPHEKLSHLYADLYYKAKDMVYNDELPKPWTQEDRHYFFVTTD